MKAKLKKMTAIVFATAALVGCATAEAVKAGAEGNAPYAKAGFYTTLDSDGRLWVFPEGSQDLADYKEKGKPVRQVRRIAAGPQGQTVISTEAEHIAAYIAAKPGFFTVIRDERLWVLPENSDDHKAFLEKGPPVRQVRRIAAGPMGMTVISTEAEYIDAYLAN
ncbi:MAG: hypothetical protein JJU29_16455 [Verrucomicrobia bacterium]|nr:hypothetical protein [Verrucomicrobiota bacterium]MCH8514104.1 hypothetical protein [Kiritimatiellia bacterium]